MGVNSGIFNQNYQVSVKSGRAFEVVCVLRPIGPFITIDILQMPAL